MSKGGNNKDLVKYIPADEKPYTDYASLRDACFDDFTSGEGYVSQAYVDCRGVLTVGIGTVLYSKKEGEKTGCVNGVQKSRFDLCGYTPEQREALINATKVLEPKDYNNKELKSTIRETVIRGKYRIAIERKPGEGTRIISVQEIGKKNVNIPQVSKGQYRQVFNTTFVDYYNRAERIIGSDALKAMPCSLQCLCVHQVYAFWNFPQGVRFDTLENACQACAASQARRGVVSDGEKAQLKHCQEVVAETRDNQRRYRIVVDHRQNKPATTTKNRQWAEQNRSKMEKRVDQRQSNKQSTRGSDANRKSGSGGRSSYSGGRGSYSGGRGGGYR